MNIAILSRSDRIAGGASRIAEDLTLELRKKNYKVEHFARSSKYTETIPLYTDFEKKIYHKLINIGIQEYIPFEYKIIKKFDLTNKYDIFHFHDINSAISPLTIKRLSDIKKNIIWTIHDCSLVTGGCAYFLDCNKYKDSCRKCPQIGSFGLAKNFDFTFLFHKIKKYVLKNSNIHFIAPSKWIADLVYETGYIKKYPYIIPNGIDTEIFKFHDKQIVRKKFSIPLDRFIILISSADLQNKYKGIKYALNIIKKLKNINPYILIVGRETVDIKEELEGIDYKFTGFVDDKYELSEYYASANVFLNTTVADNHPLTVLECMASGTPNIGFATGGIKEIVENDVDGYIIESQNTKELVNRINILYNNPKTLTSYSKNGRNKIKRDYSMTKFIENHISFYKSIL